MKKIVTNDLYAKLVETMREYLGPAAERFVLRQVTFHVNKQPDALTKEDLAKLSDSFKVSIKMLTKDDALAEKAAQNVKQLAK